MSRRYALLVQAPLERACEALLGPGRRSLASAALAVEPDLGAVAPAGVQRGTEVEVTAQRRPPGRSAGDPVLFARLHGQESHACGRRQRRQGRRGHRPRLPPGHPRPPRPHAERRQRSADVQRRRAAGSRGSRAQQRFRRPAGDRAQRHRQRRRRDRRRRLLRRRGQEGGADHGRGRRAAAGQHVLRSLRRDSRRRAVRAGPQRRRGPA